MFNTHQQYRVLGAVLAATLAGCGTEEDEQTKAVAPPSMEVTEQVSPAQEPAQATENPATVTEDTPVAEEQPEVVSAEPPAPAPPPVLVKAGGVQQLPGDEETAAAEREKYAAPAEGKQVLLHNLYGGASISLPPTVYNQLEQVLKELRSKLTPEDYVQLLGQIQFWWEKGRNTDGLSNSAAFSTIGEMRTHLEKVAQNPANSDIFPRACVVKGKADGVQFRPLVRYADGQMHYGDDYVLMSMNDQDRVTANEGSESGRGIPRLNYVWDARTEELLLTTTIACDTLLPYRTDKDTYILWSGGLRSIPYIAGFLPYSAQMNVKEKTILPVSAEGSKLLPLNDNFELLDGAYEKYSPSEQRNDKLAQDSAAAGLGVRINTIFEKVEGGLLPVHERQILSVEGKGHELRYKNRWGETEIINFLSLSRSTIAPPTSKQQKEAESEEEEKSSTEKILQGALNWPVTFETKVKFEYQEEPLPVVLDKWIAGTGNKETIPFAASATNCYEQGYDAYPHGQSEYIGVWHKGKAWIFAVPEGTQREKHHAKEHRDATFSMHEAAPKGQGLLIPMDEVAKQPKRSANLLSWEDCELLITDPDAAEDCTYILICRRDCVNRLRVNFTTGTVDYLETWEVKGTTLHTVWLEDLRFLLLPASDNHYRMLRMKPDGSAEEPGKLYLTASDGYAIALNDGRYAGSPGCETFLNYCDGKQIINMKALAPWRNRPADVLEMLQGNPEDIAALRETTKRWLRKQNYDAGNMPTEPALEEFPVAEVELPGLFTEEETLTVPVRLRATARDLSRLEVLRDGVLIPQPNLSEREETGSREVNVQVPLAPGQNWIEIIPVDVDGVAGETTRFRVIRKGGFAANLFVVALGVADYDDDTLDLQYAAKDARDIAKAWADCSGMQTRTLVLTDKEVKDASVLERISSFLAAATHSDKVVFYLAGHGMLDANMDYYYAPSSFDIDHITETGISSDSIMDCLDSTAAQTKVLLMDTCHAGELGEEGAEKIAMNMGILPQGVRAIQHRGMKVRKTTMSYTSKKRYIEEIFSSGSTRRGINMLAASAGAEFALETGEMQNGVFTASLIEALREPSWRDSNRDGVLWIDELFQSVRDAVVSRTGGMQTPSISMMENRGFNDIVYHPGYYMLRGDWTQTIAMLKRGVKLLDEEEVRKPWTTQGFLDDSSPKYTCWLYKAMLHKLPMETMAQLLETGLECRRAPRLFLLKEDLPYTSQEWDEIFDILLTHGSDANQMWDLADKEPLFNKLIQHGADVNARDEGGRTPLMQAASFNAIRKAEALLQHGADVNARDEQGTTALMRAVSPDMARVLMQHGADVSARDNDGLSVQERVTAEVRHAIVNYNNGGDETAGMNAAQVRELGVDYAEARKGKNKDEQKAIKLYIKAADMGDMKAQRWMGWRFRQGRGVPKDESKARYYFSQAAAQGDSAAAEAIGSPAASSTPAPTAPGGNETAGMNAAQVRELGVDYAEARKGKRKDEAHAIRLYIQAANMGDMKAQRWMGWRFRQGRGVPKDESRARYFFSRAAAQGDTAAAQALSQ